jgi:hypothetical protein
MIHITVTINETKITGEFVNTNEAKKFVNIEC